MLKNTILVYKCHTKLKLKMKTKIEILKKQYINNTSKALI